MPKIPDGMAQRPVVVDQELANWYRELAHRTRTHQQEHFRRALSEYRDRLESTSTGGQEEVDRGLALVRRFATGDGIDLELLEDADRRIWGLDGVG